MWTMALNLLSEIPYLKEGIFAAVAGIGALIFGAVKKNQGRKEERAKAREAAAEDYANTRRDIDDANAPQATDDYDRNAALDRMRKRLDGD